jgi:organic radical activating enzyme
MATEQKFCSLLWTHLSNEPGGTVRTCCIATDRLKNHYSEELTLGDYTPHEIFMSPHAQRIRNEIIEGGEPKNCETCWIDERNGKKSKRQIYNEYYEQWYGPDWMKKFPWIGTPHKIYDLQLIFDNTCNLKCRSCNANYSSKWVEEAKERHVPYWESSAKVPMNDMENSKFWTSMNDWLPEIKRLEIMGGEPFYMKEFKRFVDKIINDNHSHNIDMTLSTNGTIADKVFLEKMASNFKNLSFSVSIDGVGDKFEYLRHPGNWESVLENLQYFYELHNSDYPVSIQITHTITALNIMYLPEFHDFFQEHFPNFKIWNNIAHYPKWLTCSVLPAYAKKNITEKLSNHNWSVDYESEVTALLNYLNTPLYENGSSVDEKIRSRVSEEKIKMFDVRSIENKWNIFKSQIVGGDHYREENFTKVFPELYELIKNDFDYDKEYQTVLTNGYKQHSTRELVH